jgi:hypothetical protein
MWVRGYLDFFDFVKALFPFAWVLDISFDADSTFEACI